MKSYGIILIILLGLPYATLTQADDFQLIADGRLALEHADTDKWLTHPAILQASETAKQYWQANNSVYEEDFRVMDSRAGAFTQAGHQQTAVLYLLSRWPRCCSNMGLAIIDNDELIRNIALAGGYHHLSGVADLDGNGLDELALISSFGMGGSNETMLSLISLPAASVRQLASLPLIQENCGANPEHGQLNAFQIGFDKTATDKLRIVHFQTDCNVDEYGPAQSVSHVPLESVYANETYIDLPLN